MVEPGTNEPFNIEAKFFNQTYTNSNEQFKRTHNILTATDSRSKGQKLIQFKTNPSLKVDSSTLDLNELVVLIFLDFDIFYYFIFNTDNIDLFLIYFKLSIYLSIYLSYLSIYKTYITLSIVAIDKRSNRIQLAETEGGTGVDQPEDNM